MCIPANIWLAFAGLNGLLAVAAGAIGRHGAFDSGAQEMFRIGAYYQMAHALALLGVSWLASREAKVFVSPVHLAGAAFVTGTLLFSGSLYWLGVTGLVPVVGAAPAGGMLLMAGWLGLLVTALRNFSRCRRQR
jgi:uncharacterized membrane protein YgdD (TMEM256/DUF423 family)